MENIQVEKLENPGTQLTNSFNLPRLQTILRLFKRLYPALMITLALLPLLNTVIFLATTGDNVLSADYVFYVNTVTRIAEGTYDWLYFPRDSFVNTHFLPFPIFLEVVLALLTHWNTYFTIFTGVGMAAVKVIFLWDACNIGNNGKKTWFLLPLLSALTFGGSAIDVFTFGQTSVTWGFCFLGFSFGIWCLVKIKREWLTSLLLGLAGIVSCWSGAIGFLVWPAFFVMIVVLGKRKWWQYAALFGAAGLSGIPYVYFLLINPGPNKAATSIVYANFKYNIFATTYGWPFSNGIGINVFPYANDPAFWAGTLGLIAGFFAIIFYLLNWNTPVRKQAAPALALLTFGILSPFEILTFREFIGPWYNPQLLIYWLGLLMLAYVFWNNRKTPPASFGWIKGSVRVTLERWLPVALATWAVGFLLIVGFLYVTTHLTFDDKTMFLRLRSPAAASCIREYKVASEICEATLYNGNFAKPVSLLAAPLEKNYMSVFAPDQQWSLQGDFIINGKVTVEQNPNYIYKYWLENVVTEPLPWLPIASQPPTQGVYWTSDAGETMLPWSHFKHLNLFMQSPNAVTWHLTLPDNLDQANFVTAVTLSDIKPIINASDGVTFQVYIQEKGQPDKLAVSKSVPPNEHSWQPISFSLKEYAGKSISLRLTSDFGKSLYGDSGLFQYPHIDLKLDPARMKQMPVEDLTPYIPQPSATDLVLNAQNTNLWKPTNTVPASAPGDSIAKWEGQNPNSITYTKPFNACLSDYSQLYLKIGVDIKGTLNRVIRLFYRLNGNISFQPEPVILPLALDADMHNYFYDLKLLSLDPKLCLTGLNIQVLDLGTQQPVGLNFQLADVRFIRNPQAPPAPTPPSAILTPPGLDRSLPPFITVDGKALTQTQLTATSQQPQFMTGTDANWLDPQPEYPKYWPVTSGAQIFLYSSVPKKVQFQLTPVGFMANPKAPNGQGTQGTLQLVLNKTALQEKSLTVNTPYTIDIDLQAGWNTIQLNYKEGFYRPAAYDKTSTNQNQWSFMLSGINLKTAQPGTSRVEGVNY